MKRLLYVINVWKTSQKHLVLTESKKTQDIFLTSFVRYECLKDALMFTEKKCNEYVIRACLLYVMNVLKTSRKSIRLLRIIVIITLETYFVVVDNLKNVWETFWYKWFKYCNKVMNVTLKMTLEWIFVRRECLKDVQRMGTTSGHIINLTLIDITYYTLCI